MPAVANEWPGERSILSVDRGDVALGWALLLGGAGVLLILGGPLAAALVAGLFLAIFAGIGAAGLVHGEPLGHVVRAAPRLTAGFVGRWFTP